MPPTTYDDFRRKGAIGPPLENKTTTEGYRFYKKVYERFLECKIKLNTEDRSVVSISHPQDPSSEYLYRALASNSSEFRFSANFKVFQGTKQVGASLSAYDFFAIHPIQYKRNYVDNIAKIFHYVEIHTARYIEVFLYNSEQFKSTSRGNYFNTQYSVSNVTECLRLIRLTLALEPEQVEETWGRSLLDQMQENLVGNSIPLGDFHLIDLNPNNMFLSTILAYGVLAYSMERFERFRSDTSVPFLLVIDCSSIKRNKNYSDIRTYIKRIHAACYMPDGSYGADFPPKSAKDYEEYLNRPHLARRVPLIEATDKFKVEEAFSAFYDSINKSTFVRQKYPYGSLPLIITEKGDDYPEKYFFKFNAEDIKWDDEAVQKSLPFVLNVITYVTQSACVSLRKHALHSSLLTFGSSFELASIDPSIKRANDKLYLARILAASLCAIYRERKASNQKRDYMVIAFAHSVLFGKEQYSIEGTANTRTSIANESALDTLLKCIADDFERGDVFTHTRPRSKMDLLEIQYAFQQGDLLCFIKESKKNIFSNTFEKYLSEKGLLVGDSTTNDIWDDLTKPEYQDLIKINKDDNFHKFTIRGVGSFDTYAFKIDALKEYVSR